MNQFKKDLGITRRILVCLMLITLFGCSGGSGGGEPPVSEPSLSLDSSIVKLLPAGEMISPIRFINSGGGSLLECRADSLPTGLEVAITSDGDSCEITGTPITAQEETSHRITAENEGGVSSVSLTIMVQVKPSLQELPAQVFAPNWLIVPIQFVNDGGGDLTECSTELLPEGLSVTVTQDASTCLIHGTPTVESSALTYSVTAINAVGRSTAEVILAITTAPNLLPLSTQTYAVDQAIENVPFPNNGGGVITECVSESLPEGLNVSVSSDQSTCELHGTPSAAQDLSSYRVTAVNAAGVSDVWIDISVIRPMIMTWKTDNPGLSEDNQIMITTSPSEDYDYNFQVDWGDGTQTRNITGDYTHTYDAPGVYTVTISGVFPQTYFDPSNVNSSDAQKLLSVDQWGTLPWKSMHAAFAHCTELVFEATDMPRIESVTDMSSLFLGATNFNSDISQWDVSAVENMSNMFSGATHFNSDISQWDVSAVTDMRRMFAGATNFDRNLGLWNLVSVTNMGEMFTFALSFNSDISQWNVSSVTNMHSMFSGASSFNGDISQWDVSSVTDMGSMFFEATSFNGDLSQWNVFSVMNMGSMFSRASSFNSNISQWNVSSVVDMGYMFYEASSFDQNLGSWTIESVTDMEAMFRYAKLSTSNYDALLMGWAGQNVQQDIFFDAGQSAYSDGAKVARDVLIDSYNWVIYDAGNFEALVPNLEDMSERTYRVNRVINSLYFQSNGGWNIETCTSNPLPDGLTLSVSQSGRTCVISGTPTTEQRAQVYTITATNQYGSSEATVTISISSPGTAFITTWKTDNEGISENNQIQISVNQDLNYDYDIDWGDGTKDRNVTGFTTHTYASAGTYTITIVGVFPQTYFSYFQSDAKKLLSVEQWGNIEWLSGEGAFTYSNVVLNATDVPNMSAVTNMNHMFAEARRFNGDISEWDVSSVTDMGAMFRGALSFNGDISDWDVSSVSNMGSMFYEAISFNGDISRWDVSSVTNMEAMFYDAPNFNGDLSDWDVSSVTNMRTVFNNAIAFNQDLSNWNVSSVVNMSGLFNGAKAFNQDISDWNVSSVTTMANMFSGASSFSGDLSQWDVSSVTNMDQMFANATNFDSDLSLWDVSSVTNIRQTFFGATNFNSNISEWDVSSVINMEGMFYEASRFNGDISAWDVSSVRFMRGMFQRAPSFNSDLSGWDVSSVIEMQYMFSEASNFNADISGWDVSSVTDMGGMFQQATDFNSDISQWDVSSVTNMVGMFGEAENFSQDLSLWDVSSVMDMNTMFRGASSFSSDLSQWDVSSVINMKGMFAGATNFNGDLSQWNMSSVTDTSNMFESATSFNRDISQWDVSSVTDMSFMFFGATSFNQNLGSWNIESVINMEGMFRNAMVSTDNYDSLLLGWSSQNVQQDVIFDAGESTYSNAGKTARDKLINDNNWTIYDGGKLDALILN
ncbi:MAG: BspA family leucine-rich repeat surface protein [Gammaproteobacteria bacterium]|nr:BspA family leucine-rich repeat surface protein [Gammaproteobacteria bacterium]